MKKELPCLIACVLFAAGVCAQEAPPAARNTPGRYQAVTGGDNTVYVIDTDTGAMLSKGRDGWEIESAGFSNTVAAVRKRHDDARKARKAQADLVASTAETFPELSLEDKVKAAADIFVVKVQMCTVGNRPMRPRCFVTEYLRKVVGGPKRGWVYDVGGTFPGFNVDLESGAKEDIIVLCFEVRGNGTNVFVCIPTAPVKLWECATYMIVLDASPTIVEDVKKVLAKKE